MSSGEPATPPAEPIVGAQGDLLDTEAAGPAALRGSALRTGAYVLGILLSLISAPLLVRHLGVSDFGRYVAVLSLVTIVSGFTEGGLNSIVLREFATLGDHSRREMMRSAIGIRIVLTVVGVAFAVAFAAVAGYGSTLVLATALAGVGLILQLQQSLLATTLQAELRFGWASAAELIRQLVNVGLLVGLVLAGAGVLPLLAVAIPASAVSLACTVPLVRGRVSFEPSFHVGRLWSLLRETVPWAVISAVNVVYFRISIVLMSIVASALQTGYFATSFRITEVLVGIPGLVIGAAFPILARAHRDDRDRFDFASGRIFELALVAGTWLVLCLEVGAAFAIHVLAANKADPAIVVLRIQGAAVLATFVAVACGFPLLTLRHYRAVLLSNLGALFISAALTLALAPSLGARGAGVAALVAELGLAISQAAMLKRFSAGFEPRFTTVALVLLAGAAAAAAGIALPVHPLIGVVVASIVYFGALRSLGRFPPEILELLSSRRAATVR
ncbi:MAG TPA: oligosaccharide flippase family protein [Solirubrobacteraceae bacterium]|jgi:O-antigen/teichoic acid export membrane protein|nr:oligosaccharide flippase family protein [Solirubrobacteraceae bacterium]